MEPQITRINTDFLPTSKSIKKEKRKTRKFQTELTKKSVKNPCASVISVVKKMEITGCLLC
ncbi:MAG: hypothetical protein DRP56_07350 [Planctomycetota bacterium]|nr:MAG: hypothetical protein DRP56_07350 [Planctomycetota bacterium]